jgi:putative ATP-dependent endonuclease of the OLD family
MNIKKIIIENFKCFNGKFTLELNEGLNILVGDNEAGKSTILEAITLALSGWIYGKYLRYELNQSLFNVQLINDYIISLKSDTKLAPPQILIELFFEIADESQKALFEGNGNSIRESACGIQFKISFNEKYQLEYDILLESEGEISSIPIEFYDFSWSSFARESITPKIIPIKAALIDSSNTRYQSGSDVYASRIIRDFLTDEHKIKVSQAHRKLKDSFANDDSIKEINQILEEEKISNKKVELSVDISTKTAWETSLATYYDGIPFNNIGSGEQCLVKTKLALSHKKSKEANIILMEEPENHLSHSKLNRFIRYIKSTNNKKQIVISTHSSFVANKLGLANLILLNADQTSKKRNCINLSELTTDTRNYFEKLPGYNTLRMILCEKAILVEGPSDELIVQKAYLKEKGKLPIEDEVDVISVGTSFLRFLEIAKEIKKPVAIVTDNDGDYNNKIEKKYKDYFNQQTIKICADKNNDLSTLEPQIVEANKDQLSVIYDILGIDISQYSTKKLIIDYMINNKTDCALKIFNYEKYINFPKYILDAIN